MIGELPAKAALPSRSRRELFSLFLAEKRNPEPFYVALAAETVATLPFDLSESRVLDLGCGPGYYTMALRNAGAAVVPVDFDRSELAAGSVSAGSTLAADARRLPLPNASVDGVFCSNLLEHTPDASAVFSEIGRVLRPGGWAWISWTNWYSPWGGHEITPFHYLGSRLGLAVYRRFRGEPRKNVPGQGLFPVHIGSTLTLAREHPALHLVDAFPRYYASQRWIVRVPGFRELFTWNCVLLLERTTNSVDMSKRRSSHASC